MTGRSTDERVAAQPPPPAPRPSPSAGDGEGSPRDAIVDGRGYGDILALPHARRLFVTSVLARMPLGMSSLAILFLIRDRTGSFASAGLCVGAYTLAGASAGPALGALVDRLGQTRVLAPVAAMQAALLTTVVVAAHARAPVLVLAGLCALAGASVPPVSSCLRVLWPLITRSPAQRERAYAMDATLQEVIWTTGPLLVGVLATAIAPAAAVLSCAAVTVGGTAAFASCEPSRRWRGDRAEAPRGGALASPGLRLLLVSVALVGMCIGAVEVSLPALAGDVASMRWAGVVLAVWSIGSLAGGLVLGARTSARPLVERYVGLLVCLAVVTAPLLVARSLPLAIALATLAGVAYAPAFSVQYALVAALARAGTTAEAFTWSSAILALGIGGGTAAGGALVSASGVEAGLATGVLAAIAAATFARSVAPRLVPATVAN